MFQVDLDMNLFGQEFHLRLYLERLEICHLQNQDSHHRLDTCYRFRRYMDKHQLGQEFHHSLYLHWILIQQSLDIHRHLQICYIFHVQSDIAELESSGDRDYDGIPDLIDVCPYIAETYNKFQDDDGCPDSAGGISQGAPDRDGD